MPRERAQRLQAVLRTGRSVAGTRVVLYVSPGEEGFVAIVAGRRVGGAVARNRAKRILREAWRRLSAEVAGDVGVRGVVWVARPAIAAAKTQDVVKEMRELLERVLAGRS